MMRIDRWKSRVLNKTGCCSYCYHKFQILHGKNIFSYFVLFTPFTPFVWVLVLLAWSDLLSPGHELWAQPKLKVNNTGINGMDLGFRQDLNSFLWEYKFGYQRWFTRRWWLELSENYRSSLLKLSAGEQKRKDDHLLLVNVGYSLIPEWQLVLKTNSLIFDDQQSLFRNDVNALSGVGEIRYQPLARFNTALNMGTKWERRFKQNDYSFSYGADIRAERLTFEGYTHSLLMKLDNDDFNIRRNRNFHVHYRVNRSFYSNSADSLHVFVDRRRRDYFTSATGDIESLQESIRGVDNVLVYGLAPGINIMLTNVIDFKAIDIQKHGNRRTELRRKRNDQGITSDLAFNITRAKYNFNCKFAYWAQKQKYDISAPIKSSPFTQRAVLIIPDNESNTVLFSTDTGMQISRKDSIGIYFLSSRFQYDTPDTNNFDDRDELRLTMRTVWLHRLSQYLNIEVQASVNLYHMVYIFAETSANNNWNRIFRLRPVTKWRPGKNFKMSQAFEVLANYVAYDFENEDESVRSFVFRKFAIEDSLSWKFSKKSILNINYRLHLEENGRLFWSRWLEQPLVSRHNHWLRGSFDYHWHNDVTISSGITFYRRFEWRHKTSNTGVPYQELFNNFTSFGPVLRISYRPSKKTEFYFFGMRQKVMPRKENTYYINKLDLQLNWYW